MKEPARVMKAEFLASFAACGLVMMAGGCATAWPSAAGPEIRSGGTPVTDGAKDVSGLSQMFFLGSVVGALLAWPCLALVGCRRALLLTGLLHVTSWTLLALARTLIFVYGARFAQGIAQTLIVAATPVYIVEITEDRWRHPCGFGLQSFSNLGVLVQYSAGPLVSYRTLVLINLSLALVFLVWFLAVGPESPYFLVTKGRLTEARAVIAALHTTSTPEYVETQILLIQSSLRERTMLSFPEQVKALIREPGPRKALVLIMGLAYLYTFSGLSQIIMLLGDIVVGAGLADSAQQILLLAGVFKFLGGLLLPVLLLKLALKPLALFSIASSAVSMVVMMVYSYLKGTGSDVSNLALLPIVFIILFFFFSAMGFTFLACYVRAEVTPTRVKSAGVSLQEMVTTLLLFLCSLFFGYYKDTPHVPFTVFSLTLLAGLPFVYVLMPDSGGMSLQDIEKWLSK